MKPVETPQPTQPVETKSSDWPKIILVAVLGLGLLVGAAYAGYWYGTQQVQQQENPTPIVSQPTTTPTPTPTVEDQTKDWKTYTNDKCGYLLKYPPFWNLSPEPESGAIGAAMIYSYKEGDGLEGNDWLKVQIGCGTLEPDEEPRTALDRLNARDSGYGIPQITSIEQTNVGGKLAYKQTVVPPVGESVLEYYIFYKDGTVLNVGFTPSETTLTGAVDQILSTFKFLD